MIRGSTDRLNNVLSIEHASSDLSIMISLNNALTAMRSKDDQGRFIPFSITFTSIETGELITYKHVTLPQAESKQLDSMVKESLSSEKASDQNRYKATINFKSGNEFRSCHIHLITRFNNQKIF